MLPKLKLCAPEIKNLLLFRKNPLLRIENISPELKMLVLNLGSMLPVSKNAPGIEVTMY